MTVKFFTVQTPKLNSLGGLRNGGWSRVGDGNSETSLYIEKEGVTIKLKDEEIVSLMKALKGVNPSIQVS